MGGFQILQLSLIPKFKCMPFDKQGFKDEGNYLEYLNGWTTLWIRNWLAGHTQNVAVSGLMSKWRLVISGIPQGSLNNKCLSNTKLRGAVDELEGRDAIQKNLVRLESWAHAYLMKFNKARCNVPPRSQGNPKHKYRLGGERIKSSLEKKDLGVLVDEKLNMTQQCALAAQKVNCIPGCIRKTMFSRSRKMILSLCSRLVTPNLESSIQLWGPQPKRDVDLLE
ncbi:rna-directed dna polymerase from mobile element jockey-like [Pitangus sulphuratus]|nr:rna-directed dna polymerase from mobile element jockey-like [Pitangus sulphuratus]